MNSVCRSDHQRLSSSPPHYFSVLAKRKRGPPSPHDGHCWCSLHSRCITHNFFLHDLYSRHTTSSNRCSLLKEIELIWCFLFVSTKLAFRPICASITNRQSVLCKWLGRVTPGKKSNSFCHTNKWIRDGKSVTWRDALIRCWNNHLETHTCNNFHEHSINRAKAGASSSRQQAKQARLLFLMSPRHWRPGQMYRKDRACLGRPFLSRSKIFSLIHLCDHGTYIICLMLARKRHS